MIYRWPDKDFTLSKIQAELSAEEGRLRQQCRDNLNDALLLTVTEFQSLLGISYELAVKIQATISKKCATEPSTVYDLLMNQRKYHRDNFFSTSLYDLDTLLQGGLLLGNITEIAGPPGVGKTQFCIMLSLLATLSTSMGGLNGQVIYIDTESAFSSKRLIRMAQCRYSELYKSEMDIKNLLQRIFVHKATSVYALKEIISNIEQEIIKKKVKLIIIDSIASLFRKEYGASVFQSIIERNNILLEQASNLKDIAQTYGVVVFLTNQITSHSVECDPTLSEYFSTEESDCYDAEVLSDFSSELNCTKWRKINEGIHFDHIIPALGTTWSHCVNTRLVAQFLDSQIRQLIIIKSPVAPNAAVRYILNEAGIILTDDDIEFLNISNAEHQNILTKNNFLTNEVTGTGTIFSENAR